MPNRIIKESICTSPTIDRLSMGAERFFYRLIVKCDDYGLYYGDERILLGACFPLRAHEITCNQLRSWLAELERVGLIIRYQVEDRCYVSFTSWAHHQNIRAKKRKYPEPTPENTIPPLAGDGNCDQLTAIAPVTRISDLGSRYSDLGSRSTSHRATPDGEAGPPAKKKTRRKITYTEGFKAFWQEYPAHRRDHKEKAAQLFEAAIEDGATAEEITQSVIAHAASSKWQEEEGRYVPGIIKFLEGERWKEVVTAGGPRLTDKERKSQAALADFLGRRRGDD